MKSYRPLIQLISIPALIVVCPAEVFALREHLQARFILKRVLHWTSYLPESAHTTDISAMIRWNWILKTAKE
jgi:hypothetical protein